MKPKNFSLTFSHLEKTQALNTMITYYNLSKNMHFYMSVYREIITQACKKISYPVRRKDNDR